MTIRVKLLLCLNNANEHGDTLKLMAILLCTIMLIFMFIIPFPFLKVFTNLLIIKAIPCF